MPTNGPQLTTPVPERDAQFPCEGFAAMDCRHRNRLDPPGDDEATLESIAGWFALAAARLPERWNPFWQVIAPDAQHGRFRLTDVRQSRKSRHDPGRAVDVRRRVRCNAAS